MFNVGELNNSQLDFFRELENIGASHAATALSTMLGESITLRLPKVQFCEFSSICDMLNGPENVVVGLLVEMSGDINGFILLVQDHKEAKSLSEALIRALGENPAANPDDFSELQLSALKELSNILSSSYITAISTLTGLSINCTVPKLVIDMAGAVMNLLAVACGEYSDIVLFLETEFQDHAKTISGHFFLMPDDDSYRILMNKMGIL